MGRKEGSSLFHQMISTPDVFVLSQRTDKNGETMEIRFKTKESYLDWLALRAVSIQHLAHWRDKVTVQSYYFSRSKAPRPASAGRGAFVMSYLPAPKLSHNQ